MTEELSYKIVQQHGSWVVFSVVKRLSAWGQLMRQPYCIEFTNYVGEADTEEEAKALVQILENMK